MTTLPPAAFLYTSLNLPSLSLPLFAQELGILMNPLQEPILWNRKGGKPLLLEPQTKSQPLMPKGPDGDFFSFSINNANFLPPTTRGNLETVNWAKHPLSFAISLGTPGSDIFLHRRASDIEVMFARDGNDILIGSQPIPYYNSYRTRITIMFGDYSSVIASTTGFLGADRFILGDWQNSYYRDFYPSLYGFRKFAVVGDFDVSRDVIELYGTAADYVLTPIGRFSDAYYLFQWVDQSLDLVAVIAQYTAPNPTDLSLSANYFDFQGYEPPMVTDNFAGSVYQKGTASYESFNTLDVDVQGNVYIGGLTTGSLAGVNSRGTVDGIVLKYDNLGEDKWQKQISTESSDAVMAIAADNAGDSVYVYVAGKGGDANGIANGFLVRYDARTGREIWETRFDDGLTSIAWSLAVDSQDDLLIAGYATILDEETGEARDQSFIRKFDSSGHQQWIVEIASDSSGSYDEAYGVALDSQDNVFATGWTLGQLGAQAYGSYDGWLVKLAPNGDRQWIRQFGTAAADFAWDLAVDSRGDIYVTGWTFGSFEGASFSSYDAFLIKYSNEGELLWTKQVGTAADDGALGIAIDAQDSVYLTGYTNGDLGGVNQGEYDMWGLKYNSDGSEVWRTQLGTNKTEQAKDIKVDNRGQVYISGVSDGSFGALNEGSFDGFVVKLDARNGEIIDFQEQRRSLPSLQNRPAVGVTFEGSPLSETAITAIDNEVARSLAGVTAMTGLFPH